MDVGKKIRGSSLVEAIAAMAIISVVLGTGFTLYAKVVQSQKSVLKVRGSVETINSFISVIRPETQMENQASDYYSVQVNEQIFENISDVNIQLTQITDKTGKLVKETRIIIPKRP